MKKKNQKDLVDLYSDFIYSKPALKKSFEVLSSETDILLRKAYASMSDMTAKLYFAVQKGELSRSELRRSFNLLKKIEKQVDTFKKDFKR